MCVPRVCVCVFVYVCMTFSHCFEDLCFVFADLRCRTCCHMKIEKKFKGRSTPQGSSESPKFWRMFDGIFTAGYKKSMAELSNKCEVIKKWRHKSFADDHKTLMLMKFPVDMEKEQMGKIAIRIAETVRGFLDNSTTSAGCGINPDKSEIILPQEYIPAGYTDAKSDYTWLGYSFKLTGSGSNSELLFSESRCKQKIHHVDAGTDTLDDLLEVEPKVLQIDEGCQYS